MNRRADLFTSWPEYFFIILLVIGIIFSFSIRNAFLMYLIIFLSGFISGNFIFHHRKSLKFPMAIILIGFIAGFIIGIKYVNPYLNMAWLSIVLVFILGNAVNYTMNREGLIPKHDM